MTKEQIFMQYICANKLCDCIFLDKDVKGRMTPIKGTFCPSCLANGFKNPDKRPKKKLVETQLRNLKCNQLTIPLEGRKNPPVLDEKPSDDDREDK